MKGQVRLGLTYLATQLTLEHFLTEWLAAHKVSVKPMTGKRYEQISRDYILPILGKYKLKDIRFEQIEELYRTLLEKEVSIRNVRLAHSVLHKSLNVAVKRGLAGFNAAHGVWVPKMEHREMEILVESEVIQFLICAKDSRHEALFHLAIKTGMRQGELLGLKWSDLDWKKATLRVQRQAQRVPVDGMVFMPPKTRAGRRTIKLGEETLHILRKHQDRQETDKAIAGKRWQENNLIFPSKVGTLQSPSNLLKEFKALLVEAGLRKIRFHDLRHTAASLMLNHGIPVLVVSKVLGHSKPSTTLDIYGHLIPIMQDDVARLMDELVTPVPVNMGESVKTISKSEIS
jgi:integrase